MNKDIKDKIRLLKLVRTRINNQNEFYICNATFRLGEEKPELAKAGGQIRSYIRTALNADSNINEIHFGGICTLDNWIGRYRRDYTDGSRAARLQWIDWMINCYEEYYKV